MNDTPKRTDLTTNVNKPPALSRGGNLLDQAFNRLPPEKQDELLHHAVEKRLDLEVKAAEAEQGYSNFERESSETVQQVRELGKTGMDVTATYQGKTASGHWQVEVRKSNYTVIIVIAAIIGIVALILAFR